MKNITALSFTLILALLCSASAVTAEETKKKINLNAEQLKRASEIIRQNRDLFSDPEKLEAFLRLSKSLEKKQN